MPQHIESKIQIACKRWFNYQYQQFSRLLFAVPNGGQRGKYEAAIMKQEGIVAGVSDMILLMPRRGYAALCIEFKTAKGRQTDLQKSWQQTAEMVGNKYVIVRSLEQFIKEITAYLG